MNVVGRVAAQEIKRSGVVEKAPKDVRGEKGKDAENAPIEEKACEYRFCGDASEVEPGIYCHLSASR
jgi:hypothetical protein